MSGTFKYTLAAESGYKAEATYKNITPEQYGQIVAILEGTAPTAPVNVPSGWTDGMFDAAHEAMKIASPHVTIDTIVRVVHAGISAAPSAPVSEDAKDAERDNNSAYCPCCGQMDGGTL